MRTIVAVFTAMILFFIDGVVTAQDLTEATKMATLDSTVSTSAPPSLVGKWAGRWDREGRSSSSGGPMEIEIETSDGNRLAGRVRFANARKCSGGWEKLEGNKMGERISLSYDIGGTCGKATLILSVDLAKGAIVGTYSSEGAGNGDIRLKRQ